MSILTYPLGFIGGGKEFYNNVMENSLRFDGTASLAQTPSSAGSSATTFTVSWWFKLGRSTTVSGDDYFYDFGCFSLSDDV